MIDPDNPRAGIQELRYIDPRRIRKVREYEQAKEENANMFIYKNYKEYYIYNINIGAQTEIGLKVTRDSIAEVTSGVYDYKNNIVISHLHKAIKTLNSLRHMEDATVIYRITRAPERRVFKIDVGNLPRQKAEEYLHQQMQRYKNKMTFDVVSGETKDSKRFMTMLEDFWFATRDGKGTEVDTLPSGQNLGELDDVEYFKRKLYKALNVPISRLETESVFNIGRAAEITRDEVKFSKFINRLRNHFTNLFDNLLEIQLVLKGIMSKEDWKRLKEDIFYDFKKDNHFTELKNSEIMMQRVDLLDRLLQHMDEGFFSKEWVKKNILHQTEEEIKEIKKQFDKEKAEGGIKEQPDEMGFGGEPPGGGPPGGGFPPADQGFKDTTPKMNDDEDEKPTSDGPKKKKVQSSKKLTSEEKALFESLINVDKVEPIKDKLINVIL